MPVRSRPAATAPLGPDESRERNTRYRTDPQVELATTGRPQGRRRDPRVGPPVTTKAVLQGDVRAIRFTTGYDWVQAGASIQSGFAGYSGGQARTLQ